MRAAEFLRAMADMLASIEDDKPQQQAPVIVNVNGGAATQAQPQQQQDDKATGDFLPPLQHKLELMKKMAGEPNALQNKTTFTALAADEDEPFDG